ncbi:LysR family transcriptional regulator [Falsirhodobacter sp. 20TX0035]|uniref:LysR family transcriptional regulator n=1 Tax=Falsirhodobacter sp. 20TX0035 TaxID=3022019 RepID=UPI00232B1B01|nr:LysR family transcriptional regulator [Falsirhodobacter sp. 20TX0035]MDB6455207.1 LysR family transcriptional regulator [Falsirhodobacter sp. 20TX0035]
MDLNAARMFVIVVQAGSLSAAAARLDVPLPTLSRRMRELERDLNVQLLERSVRGSRLTEAGSRLYEIAVRGIDTLAEAEQALKEDRAQLRGKLRLSLPQSFRPWWALIEEFQRAYPNIQLFIHSTERRLDLIEDGIDVALRVGAIVHEGMVARHVLTWRHVLVAAPSFLARHGTPAVPADLTDLPCAIWGAGTEAPRSWTLGRASVPLTPVLATNDYEHLCRRAVAGDAVTELPPFIAASHIREGRLVQLLNDHPMPEEAVHLVYPRHRHPSAIVRTYLRFCLDRVADLETACVFEMKTE